MKLFLLDTGILGDYVSRIRGVHERAMVENRNGNRIGICVPVLAEMLYGIELSKTRERNLKRLERALPTLRVWPFDVLAAYHYGRIAAELKRIGRPMQQIDMMVAAVAFAMGNCTVVTLDSDLSAVPGLLVENWRVTPATS